MSYQEKLEGASALIQEHNVTFPSGNTGFIQEALFLNCLKFKARNEDNLKDLTYEQIAECLPKAFGTQPDGLIKDMAKLFRGSEAGVKNNPVDAGGRQVSPRRADQMSWKQLVEAFDPEDVSSSVTKRLAGVANGRAFIVFSSGRTVDVESTYKLFMELKGGFPQRENYQGQEIYKIGDITENYAEENPLYHGRPLRPDGTCDQTNRSWEGVPLNIRQIVFEAVESGEINVNVENGISIAHNVLDMALGADAEKKLRERFPKANVVYNRHVKTGDLPKLRIELGSKAANPSFPKGTRVKWEATGVRRSYVAKEEF